MSSRENILEAIRRNKLEDMLLPSLHFYEHKPEDLLSQFSHTLSGIGGSCRKVHDYEQINAYLAEARGKNSSIINAVEELTGCNINDFFNADAKLLESTEIFIVRGGVAVAENGAIWVTEKNMGNRLLPFLCQKLIIVVEAGNLVFNMYEAYEKIAIDQEGYGVFIAGPSKTADIEQSLVIGAHGPLSLDVFIMENQFG
jgi:L-lactate dehydrogenase complex protein LldG